MHKNYLENYRVLNNTPFKRTDSPDVIKDISNDMTQRKFLLDSINKAQNKNISDIRHAHCKSMNWENKQQINKKGIGFVLYSYKYLDEKNLENKEYADSKKHTKLKDLFEKTQLPNIYNLKNILAYNDQIRSKEIDQESKHGLPSVVKRIKHERKDLTINSGYIQSNNNHSQSSNVNRSLTRKSTTISKEGNQGKAESIEKSQRKDSINYKNLKSVYSKISDTTFKRKNKESSNLKMQKDIMNKDLIDDLNIPSNSLKKN